MEPFFQPDRLWPDGHRQLQLMIIPDLELNPYFASLIASCRKVMAGHAATTRPVPDDGLHVTVQPIYYPPSHEYVDAVTRVQLVKSLRRWFATVPAFEILIGSPLVYHRGVVADTHHDAEFSAMLDWVRPIINEICGPGAADFDTRPAHMALCYATGHSSSDDLQRELRHQVRPSHALLSVQAVQLVETRQDPELGYYVSDIVQNFKLRGL